ncbi:hypothetical protein [Streptomyces sp. NPDC004296]|uniref:hypothetical protein n=1 Tax=Streptomyces sp. NPDC004296 TaxID=3364697 RepID=UPI0036ADDDF2
MDTASKSGLYTYKEGKRNLFDFSCELVKDWSKAVSGQTLWTHNRDGIDKDLRTLLTENDVSAAVYVARHSTANKARVAEVAGAYKETPLGERLSRLRVFWIPGDFDADDETAREDIYNSLKEEMTRDLLIHVTLGGLTATDVARFATSPRPGYPLSILSHVKHHGFGNLTHTSKLLGISTSTLKDEIQRLFLLGMLESDYLTGGVYRIGDRGNAILDVCSRLRDYLNGSLGDNKEFEHVCRLLGIEYLKIDASMGDKIGYRRVSVGNGKTELRYDTENPTAFLMTHVYQASLDGSVVWHDPYFELPTI